MSLIRDYEIISLNKYISEMEDDEEEDDRLESLISELMTTNDFNPATPMNSAEAFSELLADDCGCIIRHIAKGLSTIDSELRKGHAEMIGHQVMDLVEKYWEKLARNRAELLLNKDKERH